MADIAHDSDTAERWWRFLHSAGISHTDWRIIIAIALAKFIMVGICAVVIGQLFDPLIKEFGWKSATVSGLATVYALACLLSGPAVGIMIDRLGSKRIMVAGIGMTAAGFLGLSFCHSLPGFYLAFLVIGIGYGGAFFLSATTLIARRMGDHKNIGMGLIMGGGSLGAAVFSVLIGWGIGAYGWRHSALAAAVLMLAMMPLVMTFVPVGADFEFVRKRDVEEAHHLPPLKLLISPAFMVIAAAGALAALGMTGIYIHAVQIFMKAGYSNASASAILGSSWVMSGLGSLVSGAIANRLGTRKVLAASLLLGAIGTTLLAFLTAGTIGLVAVAIFIVFWGATANAINQFVPILLADYYGPAHLGTLTGIQGALMGVVGSLAPLGAGILYDLYTSYQLTILASTLATVMALLLVLLLKPQNAQGDNVQSNANV